MEPIRVLQEDVIMDMGGIEVLLMNLYRHIDREALQFDFMMHRPDHAFFEEEIRSLGGRIYRTPPFNPFKLGAFKKSITDILSSHPEYNIIHCHAELNLWPLKYAHELGVPVRIAHSHNAKTTLNLKYFFFLYEKMFIKNHCTDMFMCSPLAGEWSFGKKAVAEGKVHMLKNGIVTDDFRYNEAVRREIREELGLTDEIAVGHVGRFMKQKNHAFLIEIFREIHRKNPKTVLFLTGMGELEDSIRSLVSEYGLTDSVRFLGVRNDTVRLYQAFDLFLFPSLWEGLPVTAIEAQTAGLPVLMTDVIADETVVTGNVTKFSLTRSAEEWADKALDITGSFDRCDVSDQVKKAGFDIIDTAQRLQAFYIDRHQKAEHEKKNR